MSNSSEGIKLKIGNQYRIIDKVTNINMGIYKYVDTIEPRMAQDGYHIFKNDNGHEIQVYSSDILENLFKNNDNKYIIQDIILPLVGYKDRNPDTGEEYKGGKKSQRRRRKSKRRYRNRRYTRKK
jgi:hypothetical protein